MINFLHINTEANLREDLFGNGNCIPKGPGANYRSRWAVCNSKHEVPATLVGDSNTVLVELLRVVLLLRFLEL